MAFTTWKLDRDAALLCGAVQIRDPDHRGASALSLEKRLGSARLEAFAERNDVVPLVAHALLDSGRSDDARHWERVHHRAATRMTRLMSAVDEVSGALDAQGIPVVALKNAGIARGLHHCAACCPMGDLDLLVRPRDFREAHRVVLSLGYRFEFRSPLETADLEHAERSGGAEYWKPLDDGEKLWLELQWRPVAGRWIRPDQEPHADGLMERSIAIAGTSTRLLAPNDNLLQVALHTAKHSYVRAPGFRLHTDVDRVVHYQAVDWDRFVRDVHQRGVRTATYFSLRIPRDLLGTPIPPEVLQQLQPPAWKRAWLQHSIAQAGLLNPQDRKFRRISYLAFNALLYDDLSGLWRGIFPAGETLRQTTPDGANRSLVSLHLRRIRNLLFRRQQT